MRAIVIIVADSPATVLGLAQAMLKAGYQIATAGADAAELDLLEGMKPGMVLLRPPSELDRQEACLLMMKQRFIERGIPVITCVPTEEDAHRVRRICKGSPVLVGSPLQFTSLHALMEETLSLARRNEVRIRTDLSVAHREPGLGQGELYYYDSIISLSLSGCFIQTTTPWPLDARVDMAFCLGSGTSMLKISGTVRRHGMGSIETDGGMGVEFDGLTSEQRDAMESYLVTQLAPGEVGAMAG